MSIEWIAKALKQDGKSKSGLARAMGLWPSAVSDLLAGKRRLRVDELPKAVEYLGVDPPRIGEVITVPLVGYVGAGSHYHPFEPTDYGEVEAPEGATADTVAVEIRGDSLGSLFDRWLVYYDEIRTPPTSDMIGRLCVVGIYEGDTVVKQIRPGTLPNRWTLTSSFEPPIYDVPVAWAARVKQMSPR